ncbi:hypothetical protein RRG08_015631 [Elysia crispata]|uniref:Protein kinase domain-containing protein n=1 Tax=Elysia crispata TaxID=231223 RepID=A0AAE1CTY4_9GAST|nr:hypothetical protein RRG08_015631 [Elysia crispata]
MADVYDFSKLSQHVDSTITAFSSSIFIKSNMNRYQISKQLGDGTYGSVLLATAVENNEKVAIKKLTPSLELIDDRLNPLVLTGHSERGNLFMASRLGSVMLGIECFRLLLLTGSSAPFQARLTIKAMTNRWIWSRVHLFTHKTHTDSWSNSQFYFSIGLPPISPSLSCPLPPSSPPVSHPRRRSRPTYLDKHYCDSLVLTSLTIPNL